MRIAEIQVRSSSSYLPSNKLGFALQNMLCCRKIKSRKYVAVIMMVLWRLVWPGWSVSQLRTDLKGVPSDYVSYNNITHNIYNIDNQLNKAVLQYISLSPATLPQSPIYIDHRFVFCSVIEDFCVLFISKKHESNSISSWLIGAVF